MDRLAPPTSILDGNGRVPVVVVRDLWKQFGDTAALAGVSLEVRAGQIQVIMGPSGCGKSVLLKHLVGLLRPSRGEVMVFGEPVHALPEDALDALRMRIGVVFQSAALFDSLTVAENVAFPLKRHRGMPAEALAARGRELLEMVEVEGTEPPLP